MCPTFGIVTSFVENVQCPTPSAFTSTTPHCTLLRAGLNSSALSIPWHAAFIAALQFPAKFIPFFEWSETNSDCCRGHGYA